MTVRAENEQIQKQIRTLLASDTADSIPLDTYESIFDIEQKTRQNILADMQLSVSIYADKNAQEQASDVNFNIENFINSNGVLFITSPVDKQKLYAPLIAVFLENIRQAIYKRYARFQQGELTAEPFPVFFILDEVANTAPIPLLNIISEAGGQGLHIIAVLQDLNQAEKQWGILGRGILSHFPNKLLLNGISDADTVSGISIIQGEYDQQFITQSVGLQGITNNYQIRKERNLKPDQIAHIPPNQALHLTKGGYEYLNLYAVYESPFNTIRNKYAQ
jgi:type IV secretory pathway TraG/TraD family ATPase VirD4